MPVRGFIIVLVCVSAGLILGLLVGLMMGALAPDFCVALFGGLSRDPALLSRQLDGRQLGIGLGLANGVWIGLIAGIALVIAEAIKSKKPVG